MVLTTGSLEDTATSGSGALPVPWHGRGSAGPLRKPCPLSATPPRLPKEEFLRNLASSQGSAGGLGQGRFRWGSPSNLMGSVGAGASQPLDHSNQGGAGPLQGRARCPRTVAVSPQSLGRRRQAGLQRGRPVGGRGGPADEVCCCAFLVRRRLRAADGHEHAPPSAATADAGWIADHTGPVPGASNRDLTSVSTHEADATVTPCYGQGTDPSSLSWVT